MGLKEREYIGDNGEIVTEAGYVSPKDIVSREDFISGVRKRLSSRGNFSMYGLNAEIGSLRDGDVIKTEDSALVVSLGYSPHETEEGPHQPFYGYRREGEDIVSVRFVVGPDRRIDVDSMKDLERFDSNEGIAYDHPKRLLMEVGLW